MHNFLNFFYAERGGIFVLLACVGFLSALIRYIAWIFELGRFGRQSRDTDSNISGGDPRFGNTASKSSGGDGRLGFVIATFFTNLINDFRHFLALILVLIFAAVLTAAIFKAGDKMADISSAIQTVTATLGGLIGSIIGYYFGESAVKRSQSQPGGSIPTPAGPSVQSPTPVGDAATAPPITPAPGPPPAPST